MLSQEELLLMAKGDSEWAEERIRLGKNMRSDGQIAQAEALAAPRIEADDRRESGAGMIAAERSRQVNDEGYAPEGDDGYTQGELTRAAMAYADAARKYVLGGSDFHIQRSWDYWPWDVELFKPRVDPIPNLVRAGALIAARGCLVGAV